MKKFTAAVTAFVLLLGVFAPVHADEHPHEFWAMDDKYQAARSSGNTDDIIKYGKQEIELYKNMADSETKRSIITSRYSEIAAAYRKNSDFAKSAEYYKLLHDYASPLGSKYEEIVKGAKARYEQYTPEIAMYTDNGASPNYGAKNEKNNGVLFGLCSNGETRSKLDNESMVLVYQELGQPLLPYNTNVVKKANEEGIAVEFALNCPNEAGDIRNIKNLTSYLEEISSMIKKYPDTPVYLRFAAEFDVWSNRADSSSFKEAFRYVSSYFRGRNSNVAIVWSPNQVSSWDVDIDDYYPGDEYVDWVGVSSYARKYFNDRSKDEDQDLFFKNGINSEPVLALRDIVEKYGNRKPIMLSESGCGHKVMQTGEDTTGFALTRLREYFGWLPMVYPQIKLIAYFDHYVGNSNEKNDYRLSTSTALQSEYLKLTKGARFIQDSYANSSPFCYRKVTSGISVGNTFLLSCYAHKYGADVSSVTYFIDDKYAGMSDEIPFSTYVTAGERSGKHTLKAIAKFDDGTTMTKENEVNISSAGKDITVQISGYDVNFDQKPVIYNDRTMVPMRMIFEELNADVSWDGSTKTATGKRGDRTVKIAVGDSKMYVNHKQILLDTSPIILGDRTLVPVRAVAEGLGCDVGWDGQRYLVSIEPKVFSWSDWAESVPSDVDDDMYYIESKDEYRTRTRTRQQEYFTRSRYIPSGNFVREDVSYGGWGGWQDNYISASDDLEVETRTQSTPVTYTYYHYCTGWNDDESIRYKTANYSFTNIAAYHVLGTYDNPLPYAPDGEGGQVLYLDDGNMYRCDNSCYRWYEKQEGGSYTQYRSRPIYREYVYWDWSDWSSWSSWSDWREGTPPNRYSLDADEDMEIDNRTMYRYKEK